MECQTSHLRQIAHRRLAAIELPVCIRGKTGGGIKRQSRRHIWQALRVKRQPLLRAFDADRGAACRPR